MTVLGITFKENIPDIRNSKSTEIVKLLQQDGIQVQVYDPMADKERFYKNNGINLLDKDALLPADAVVLAVAHREFVEGGWVGIEPLLKENKGVVVDIQRILDKDSVPQDINLLRI